METGVTVKVWLLFEAVGEADIFTQVVKLSAETCKLPEQLVSVVLVVTVDVSIASLKVTATVVLTETFVVLSTGDRLDTVGAVVSEVVVLELEEALEEEELPESELLLELEVLLESGASPVVKPDVNVSNVEPSVLRMFVIFSS